MAETDPILRNILYELPCAPKRGVKPHLLYSDSAAIIVLTIIYEQFSSNCISKKKFKKWSGSFKPPIYVFSDRIWPYTCDSGWDITGKLLEYVLQQPLQSCACISVFQKWGQGPSPLSVSGGPIRTHANPSFTLVYSHWSRFKFDNTGQMTLKKGQFPAYVRHPSIEAKLEIASPPGTILVASFIFRSHGAWCCCDHISNNKLDILDSNLCEMISLIC